MYAAASVKRLKVTREATRPMENAETFQGIGRIEYKPDANYTCDEQLSYRYYNAAERIHGRTMEEWLRPSVVYNTEMSFYTHQAPILYKTLEVRHTSMETTKKNIRAMFELCLKMGVKFWSGYEDDLVPDGDTFEENSTNYEQICELLNEYQQKTGVKPLWIGVNFQHSRYANGAMTNPDPNVMAFAGYQTKRTIEMAHRLNAECFLINGHRETYVNTLNTDLGKEIKHYSRFLKLLIEHRDKIGFRGQMLFAHQNNLSNTDAFSQHEHYYTNNAFDLMLLLKHLNYDRYFKINVRPGHAFNMAHAYGCSGCLNIKSPEDYTTATLTIHAIVEKGGFGQCGITFDLPFNNHSYVEAKEAMESYVSALDSYGKALRFAVKLLNDAPINKQLQTRYSGFQTGWGMKFMTLDASLQECEDVVKKLNESNAPYTSNKSNHWFVVLQRYVDAQNLK